MVRATRTLDGDRLSQCRHRDGRCPGGAAGFGAGDLVQLACGVYRHRRNGAGLGRGLVLAVPTPAEHKWLTVVERDYIEAGQLHSSRRKKHSLAEVRALLSQPKFWTIAIPRMLAGRESLLGDRVSVHRRLRAPDIVGAVQHAFGRLPRRR